MTEISFTNQVVVITGAGGGLGRAYAHEVAGRGARVVVNDIGDGGAAADRVAAEIEALGGSAVASHDSVATSSGGRAVTDLAVAHFGTVHAVIHNAGMTWSAPFDELSDDDIDTVLDVHLHGAFFVLRPVWRLMREQNYGRIVHVSSSAATFGREYGASYAAAKAGLLGLSRSLAHEGAPSGIVVNTVLPYAETSIFDANPLRGGPLMDRIMNALRRLYAIGLPPEDVAPLVGFLASEACTEGGHVYWACGRRYAEAFVGLAEGWQAPRTGTVSAGDIATHLAEIRRRDVYTVPASIAEELEWVLARLGDASIERAVDT